MLLLTKESPFVRFPPRRLPSLGAKAAPRKANSLSTAISIFIEEEGRNDRDAAGIRWRNHHDVAPAP
jgi:hypothetical protein